MSVDYDEKRDAAKTQVEGERKTELTDLEKTYGKLNADGTYTGGLIGTNEKTYNDAIAKTQEWQTRQEDIQNQQTDFAIQQIEQQKAQAKKDYTKEQSGAYVDWQKQSNQYGANAEQKAAQGMTNTGYSESSQVQFYNTYQNRVAIARESFDRVVMNYNNKITEAKLQNSAALAEIALRSFEKQTEFIIAKLTTHASLVSDLTTAKNTINTRYDNKYQDVLEQINYEEKLAVEIEQAKKENEFKQAQIDLEKARLAEEQRQFNILHPATTGGTVKDVDGNGGGNGGSGGVKKTSPNSTSIKEKQLNKTPLKKTLDINNLLELGLAGKSAATIDKMVADGKLEEYTDGNKIKFRKVVTLPTTKKTGTAFSLSQVGRKL